MGKKSGLRFNYQISFLNLILSNLLCICCHHSVKNCGPDFSVCFSLASGDELGKPRVPTSFE